MTEAEEVEQECLRNKTRPCTTPTSTTRSRERRESGVADSNVHHEHRQPRDAGVMHGGWATDFSDASRDTEDRAQIRGIGPQIGIELYCRIVLRVPLRARVPGLRIDHLERHF